MIIYRKKKVIITVNHVVLKSLPNLEINLFLNNVTEILLHLNIRLSLYDLSN